MEVNLMNIKKHMARLLYSGTGQIGGFNIGIIANQRTIQRSLEGEMQLGWCYLF